MAYSRTYRNTLRTSEALKEAGEAVRLVSGELEPGSLFVLQAKLALLKALMQDDEDAAALELATEILTDAQQADVASEALEFLPLLDLRTAVLRQRASLHANAEDHDAALADYREVVRDCEFALGDHHIETLAARAEQKGVEFRLKPTPTSLEEALIAIRALRDVEGGTYTYFGFLGNLGGLCNEVGMYEDAATILGEANLIGIREFEDDHPRVILVGGEYAEALMELGQYDDALAVLMNIVPKADEVFGLNDPHKMLAQRLRLCKCLFELGNRDRAVSIFNKTLQSLPYDAKFRRYFFGTMFRILTEGGHTEAAIQQLETELQTIDSFVALPELDRIYDKSFWLEEMIQLEEFSRAESHVRNALEAIETVDPNPLISFQLNLQLAECLSGQDQHEAAQDKLLDTKQRIVAAISRHDSLLLREFHERSLEQLLKVYEKLGDAKGLEDTVVELAPIRISRELAAAENSKAKPASTNKAATAAVEALETEDEIPETTPESVTIAGQELRRRTFLNGRLKVLVPVDFQLMEQEVMRTKYPNSNRPDFVFTNPTTTVNITVMLPRRLREETTVEEIHDVLGEAFSNLYPNAEFFRKEIAQVHGSKWSYFDMLLPAVDTMIRNKILTTSYRGRMLQVSFNCIEAEAADWEPVGEAIIQRCELDASLQ